MRRRAFTLVETLIVVAVFATVCAALWNVLWSESSSSLVRRDMERLERWLASALVKADRWKSGFTLSVVLPQGVSSRHYMRLRWNDESLAVLPTETFYAESGVKWRLQGSNRSFVYQWQTHSVTPAFVITALGPDGKQTGDTLTVSLRAQLTRRSGGKIM